jgi:ABC-type bacteriocin/lantibiotic exporter with double-glycine peptidase domain
VTSGLLLIVQLLDSVLYNNPCKLLQGLILVVCYTVYIGGCLPMFWDRLLSIFKSQATQELLHNVPEE